MDALEGGGTADVAVLTVSGEVDAATVADLADALDGVVRGHDRHVVVDASGVTFIDSTGVSAIMDAQRRLNRTRRRLGVVCEPGSPLGRALSMTGLDHSFDCHDDLDGAMSTLQDAPLLGR